MQFLRQLPPVDPHAVASWVDVAASAGVQAATMLGAVITASLPLMPVLIPYVRSRIQDERARRGFDAVSRAGTIAATAYADELERLLSEAQKPESPGGVAVTEEERRSAVARATATGWAALVREGAQGHAVGLYGSEEEAKAAIRQKAIFKNEGPPIQPAS